MPTREQLESGLTAALKAVGLYYVLKTVAIAIFSKINKHDFIGDPGLDGAAAQLAAVWHDFSAWWETGRDGVTPALAAAFVALLIGGAEFYRRLVEIRRHGAVLPSGPGRQPVAPEAPLDATETRFLGVLEKASASMGRTVPRESQIALARSLVKGAAELRAANERLEALRSQDSIPLAPVQAELDAAGDPALAEALRSCARRAVVLAREFPRDFSRQSLSFFGGLPMAERWLRWPEVHPETGTPQALNFVAQIHLPDLPDLGLRSLLPEDGTLYFFVPSLANFRGDVTDAVSAACVVYRPPGDGDWAEVTPPETIIRHRYRSGETIRWDITCLREADRPWLPRSTLYPRWDMRLAAATEVSTSDYDGIGEIRRNYAGDGPDAEPRAERLNALARALTQRSTDAVFDPVTGEEPRPKLAEGQALWRPDADFPARWLEIDTMAVGVLGEIAGSRYRLAQTVLRLEAGEARVMHYGSYARAPEMAASQAGLPRREADLRQIEHEAEAARREGAPDAGKLAERAAAARRGNEWARDRIARFAAGARVIGDKQEATADWLPDLRRDIAAHDAAIAEGEAWLKRAAAGRLERAVSPGEGAEFWRWWTGLTQGRIWFEGGATTAAPAPFHKFNDIAHDAFIRTAEACLGYSAETARLVAPETVALLRQRHEFGAARRRNPHGLHRMFGWPVDIQETANARYGGDHVMLLQLDFDRPMDWHFGDSGVFQFWIRPEDLQARHFAGVKLTFEGY